MKDVQLEKWFNPTWFVELIERSGLIVSAGAAPFVVRVYKESKHQGSYNWETRDKAKACLQTYIDMHKLTPYIDHAGDAARLREENDRLRQEISSLQAQLTQEREMREILRGERIQLYD